MAAAELDVLLEQVGEMLAEGMDDGEAALELASAAGLAARLGATADQLADAVAWRDGAGAALLDEGWSELDLEELADAIDGLLDGEASDEDVEEALWDVDDVVAAAIWTKRTAEVLPFVRALSRTVRDSPDVFAHLGDYADELLRLSSVAFELDAYDYWVAVAQAARAVQAEE